MNDIFLIKKPWVTEKATELQKTGTYVFMVKPRATKNEIKKAIRELYRVEVVRVATIRRHPKQKGARHLKGSLPGYKKAVVTLKDGQRIDIR